MPCEDYPCCGHTPEDPCEEQWYDRPGAFDTTIPGNEHALCDHENGDCNVDYEGEEEEKEGECPDCGLELDDPRHCHPDWDLEKGEWAGGPIYTS